VQGEEGIGQSHVEGKGCPRQLHYSIGEKKASQRPLGRKNGGNEVLNKTEATIWVGAKIRYRLRETVCSMEAFQSRTEG